MGSSNVSMGHPVPRRDPLWACRLFSPFSPSATEYGILGGQTQWKPCVAVHVVF